jgi:hypothetical protein
MFSLAHPNRKDTEMVKTTGGTIYQVQDDSAFVGTPYQTGWLAGMLYVSTDGRVTWAPADGRFLKSRTVRAIA